MQETYHDHHTPISFGGRPICNLRLAGDIDLMGRSNGELQDFTNTLVDRAMVYGMEVGTEKNKIMAKNTSADISMNAHKLRG